MRKRTSPIGEVKLGAADIAKCLDVATMTEVEVTSESVEYPIENVFEVPSRAWRAEFPGPQTIRLLFDKQISIRHILLRFSEGECRRTQEFALSWAADPMAPTHEIVRQQWVFCPDGSTEEVENYSVTLDAVGVLQLDLKPDISGGNALASVSEWRIVGP